MTEPLCPKCNSSMVLRTAKTGRNAGNKFWGCSKFPDCRGTLEFTSSEIGSDENPENISIAGRNLGSLALPDFCPRCFWIKLHCNFKFPFQIQLPGIFSTIDSVTKKTIHSYFDKNGELPQWLSEVGAIQSYLDSSKLSWRNFAVEHPETNVHLQGSPDDIFVLKDGSYFIIDYKTAKLTEKQDELFPLYKAQLNIYAYIGNKIGLSPVTQLALCYTEPISDTKDGMDEELFLDFSPTFKPVELLSENYVEELLRKTREIYDLKKPPERTEGCKDCMLLERLIKQNESGV